MSLWGDSFMLHQIRKVISSLTLVTRDVDKGKAHFAVLASPRTLCSFAVGKSGIGWGAYPRRAARTLDRIMMPPFVLVCRWLGRRQPLQTGVSHSSWRRPAWRLLDA